VSFTIATYNVLANAYIRPAWYPRTPPGMLVAAYRGPALVRHILGLVADGSKAWRGKARPGQAAEEA